MSRSGRRIPQDVSFDFMRASSDWGFFDLLHVHSLELTALDTIRAVLDRCDREKKGVIVTVHDVDAMFETAEEHRRKLLDVWERGVQMVTLTDRAARRICDLLGIDDAPVVSPHGYVVSPDDVRFGSCGRSSDAPVRFLLYGGFRPNRVMHPVCVNASFGLPEHDILAVLTRGISPIDLRDGGDAGRTVDFAARAKDRVEMQVRPFPSDDDVIQFLSAGHALVMPYLWGSHSGQLEAAFDLGLVPVISEVSFVREQWEQHAGLVPEPIWFDWSDGSDYAYGPRLLDALLRARERVLTTEPRPAEVFREHRQDEHRRTLSQHRSLYDAATIM